MNAPATPSAPPSLPIIEGLFSLASLGLYMVFVQHLLCTYVYKTPEDSWLRQGWKRVSRGPAYRAWYVRVGSRFNSKQAATEPDIPRADGD